MPEKHPDDPQPNFDAGVRPDCMRCHAAAVPIERTSRWVCPWCGTVTDRYYDEYGNVVLDSPVDVDSSSIIKIIGLLALDGDCKALLEMSYDAKEDLKATEFTRTGRAWNDELGYWQIDRTARGIVVEHLRSQGWEVYDLVSLRSPSQ